MHAQVEGRNLKGVGHGPGRDLNTLPNKSLQRAGEQRGPIGFHHFPVLINNLKIGLSGTGQLRDKAASLEAVRRPVSWHPILMAIMVTVMIKRRWLQRTRDRSLTKS